MNPLRKDRSVCANDCPPEPLFCRYDHATGKAAMNPLLFSVMACPKYFCPHEWEISAVKS